MVLELSVVSYHRLSPRQVAKKRFDKNGGTLGRSEQADWCLPDPERVVSGVHARIQCHNDQFFIEDQSTNGLFVNRSAAALGPGNRHLLQQGDMLCFGDYEIQVAIVPTAAQQAAVQTVSENASQPVHQTVTDPFAPVVDRQPPVRHAAAAKGLAVADFTPIGASVGHSAFNHNSILPIETEGELGLDGHFLAPSALIPDDWQSDWLQPNSASSHAVKPSAEPVPVPAAKPAAQNITNADACLQAFLEGLGISPANRDALNSVEAWEKMGHALQQSLLGVIGVMRERSVLKNRIRVNQTTFQQRENNPLKFSAGIDDAVHNLFNRPSSSFMPVKQAIAEAFADISMHEAAILAGAGGAVDGVMQQLNPLQIEDKEQGSSLLDKVNPAQRQARYWQRFKALHNDLAQELGQSAQQGLTDEFVRAYESFIRSR